MKRYHQTDIQIICKIWDEVSRNETLSVFDINS